ncbi:MAG TPA: PGPGW domain-containing protein [Candidatus Saccharimonadales bacterium]|nr:PGPGW domain-containing protein [Candidatus Saccharimonadales bacterium]
MEKLKHRWNQTPTAIRKPIVTVVGVLFIIASILTGWLPGPGGIPLFLIGIAVLASEFTWAERVRDRILHLLHRFGIWFKAHRILGTLLIIWGVACGATLTYFLYFR